MIKLSQNKKIALSAIAIFLVTFVFMLLFLETSSHEDQHAAISGHADVIGADHQTEDEGSIDLEAHYRSVADNSTLPIFATDIEGRILYASSEYAELLDIEAEKLKDRLYFDFINSKDLPLVISAYAKIIQSGEDRAGLGPYRMIKGDEELLVLLNSYAVIDEDEVLTEIVFAVNDLTKQAEELNRDENEEEKKWIYDLYPKIKDMPTQSDTRMMVDKITYKEE